jgi:hypothetical protein
VSDPSAALTWKDVIPQHPDDLLQSAVALKGDFLVTRYLRDVVGVLQLHELSTGKMLQPLKLPGLGSIGISGSRKSTEFFLSFSSKYRGWCSRGEGMWLGHSKLGRPTFMKELGGWDLILAGVGPGEPLENPVYCRQHKD